MKQSTNRRKALNAARDPVSEYMAVLHDVYPPSTGAIGVVRPDRRVIVNVSLPRRAPDRIRLFAQMAEVGTRLLLETGEFTILSEG